MPIVSAQSLSVADPDLLGRLYNLKRQQLDRASERHANSLLCRVLAAEADAIGDAMTQAEAVARQSV
jgi:hypothetical protein